MTKFERFILYFCFGTVIGAWISGVLRVFS